MEFINALLKEAAAKSEMDPSKVTARDVATYVSQVKRHLKGKKMTKSTVAGAVREIAEDDPKFSASPKAIPVLVKAVCAKVCESFEGDAELLECFDSDDLGVMMVEGDDKDDRVAPGKFSASTPMKELKAQAAYLKKQIADNSDKRSMQIALKRALKKIEGFMATQTNESAEISPRANQALLNKLDEVARIDVDDLSVSEIHTKLLAAAKQAHPDVKGMKVHADDKMMRVEVPGSDRCYATVSLTTGVLTILKEGWDNETDDKQKKDEEEEEEVADKKALSPRAKAAMAKKGNKGCKMDESVVAEPTPPTQPKKSFIQTVFDAKGIN